MGKYREPNEADVVLKLVRHIQNPCGTKVNGITEDIREFYLREAERILPTLTGPIRRILEREIEIYS